MEKSSIENFSGIRISKNMGRLRLANDVEWEGLGCEKVEQKRLENEDYRK
jgi:hypothetical protein